LGFYPEDRYLFPLIPLYALIAAASFGPLSDRWSYLRERRHLFLIPVSALLFATTAWKQEQSQGSWWIAKPFVKSQEALAHCRNAVQLARKRDFQGARRDFDSCAEQLPSFAPAHFGLATVRYSMGEKTMAEQSLRQALDMVPYFAEAHVMLGDLLSEHAPNEARSQFNSCIDARSDFSPCYLSMAILDFQEHRYEAALTGFETYMALNRQALRNAQEVCNSKKESRWMAPCSDNVLGQLHDVTDSDNPLVSGMMSGIVRDYLYMRTRSYGTDAWAPVDRRLGLQVGVTHEALGNLEEARRYYRRHLDLH
ncbi:uncharacterized protein METZ01_LOCUS364605, partial [marine metagenome]